MIRIRPSVLAASLTAGLWLACGDDYGESGSTSGDAGAPLVGDVGGACFADGTCKIGLVCLSSLCVAPPDSGAESDAADAGDNDDASLRCPVPRIESFATPAIACGKGDTCDPAVEVCCNNGGWTCSADCPGTAPRLKCDSNDDCGAGLTCCFRALDPNACGARPIVVTTCEEQCGSAYGACGLAGTCPSGAECPVVDFLLPETLTVLRRKACPPGQ